MLKEMLKKTPKRIVKNESGKSNVPDGMFMRCPKCKEIISISAEELASQRYFPTCPKCGAQNEKIHNWNPIEGHCPKCGKKMQAVPEMIIMAD